MLLFVGLGNPGREYAGNRHNIGFMAIDAIARACNLPPFRKRFQGEASEVDIAGERVVLLKPATFMNESGRAVVEAMQFYKAGAGDVLVGTAVGAGLGALTGALVGGKKSVRTGAIIGGVGGTVVGGVETNKKWRRVYDRAYAECRSW